jgi:hypothetical protein
VARSAAQAQQQQAPSGGWAEFLAVVLAVCEAGRGTAWLCWTGRVARGAAQAQQQQAPSGN